MAGARNRTGLVESSSSYNGLSGHSDPNGECVFNVSKETTKRELIRIEGIPEYVQRLQGINMSGGHTNAVEICCELFKMPELDDMLEAFEAELASNERKVA